MTHKKSVLPIIFLLLLCGCTQAPVPGVKPIITDEPVKPPSYLSDDQLTLTVLIPHGVNYSNIHQETESVPPDLILDPILTSISDDSLKKKIKDSILAELPSNAFEYKLSDAIIDDRTTTLIYKVDKELIETTAQTILDQEHNKGSVSSLPLSMEINLPAPENFYGLNLLLPCEGIPVPEKAALLPNAPRSYRAGTHRGIDFNAVWGTPVRAVAKGVIIRADHNFREVDSEFRHSLLEKAKLTGRTPTDILEYILLGKAIYVDHGLELVSGYRAVSIYAHLSHINKEIIPGVLVTAGQIIGRSGNTGTDGSSFGNQNGSHLHWELILQNSSGEYYLGQGMNYDELYPFLVNLFYSGEER